jgi:thymidine kinase
MAKLYFYYSSMNAGKSTALLQSSYNYRERGMNTLVLTPHLDDRYGIGKVTSRIGLEANATSFRSDADLYELISARNDEEPLNCVLLDEAQFLTKEQVFQLGEVTDELDIPVLAYGIRTDFQGEPFPGSKYLLAWADNLKELKAICFCGNKATMVIRDRWQRPLRFNVPQAFQGKLLSADACAAAPAAVVSGWRRQELAGLCLRASYCSVSPAATSGGTGSAAVFSFASNFRRSDRSFMMTVSA